MAQFPSEPHFEPPTPVFLDGRSRVTPAMLAAWASWDGPHYSYKGSSSTMLMRTAFMAGYLFGAAAQRIEARSDETVQPAQPSGQEPDGKADAPEL